MRRAHLQLLFVYSVDVATNLLISDRKELGPLDSDCQLNGSIQPPTPAEHPLITILYHYTGGDVQRPAIRTYDRTTFND